MFPELLIVNGMIKAGVTRKYILGVFALAYCILYTFLLRFFYKQFQSWVILGVCIVVFAIAILRRLWSLEKHLG